MTKKHGIGLPKIAWSRCDDGSFQDVEDDWGNENEFPVQVYWIRPLDAQKLYNYLVKKSKGFYTTRDEAKELVKIMERG